LSLHTDVFHSDVSHVDFHGDSGKQGTSAHVDKHGDSK
jgi:hypothetical protein